MFGMSSEEFWEESPQLYWAYRTFYFKKIEAESQKMTYQCWLQGKINSVALSVSLGNAFGKQKIDYPEYDEMFKSKKEITEEKELTPREKKNKVNLTVQQEWAEMARF